jgi:hypothetical protein
LEAAPDLDLAMEEIAGLDHRIGREEEAGTLELWIAGRGVSSRWG